MGFFGRGFKMLNANAIVEKFLKVDGKGIANNIEERLSKELVIALVGPVGSGVSTAGKVIERTLRTEYGYDVCPIIKLSDFIKNEARRVGHGPIEEDRIDEYVHKMQDIGNMLREKFGGSYLIQKAIERIRRYREENGGYIGDVVKPDRRAYIIDSIKNEEELNNLRLVYNKALCVVGVFAPEPVRSQRLVNDGASEDQVGAIFRRDQGEGESFGQKTRKLFVQSDFFVCNDHTEDDLRIKVERFLSIVFGTAIRTPTMEETAMYKASASAANSACMSRQVGAAIVSRSGELIAIGYNDVPKYKGGLYLEDDRTFHGDQGIIDKDKRCYNWETKTCHNEVRKKKILGDVVQNISNADGLIEKGKTAVDVAAAVSGTGLDDLIEFSRSIHAEMEAILSVAREGKHSLVGSILYTTTYPCHNCARHIVASGISEVVYIEPYSKSLAMVLHKDSITERWEERDQKVLFRQFDGVAPDNYLMLFKSRVERKRDGRLNLPRPHEAIPIFRIPLDAQSQYEDQVIADLAQKES